MKNRTNRNSGFSFIELIVVMMLAILGLALIIPRARSNESTLTTKGAAEELVSKIRRARQTAMTKGVPVAVAIPNTGTSFYSDTVYQLEGELNPDITSSWTMGQRAYETVFFTGQWPGTNWAPGERMATSSQNFQLAQWWDGAPPEAALFVFTPSGDAVSNIDAGDGEYRIVVAQGVSASGRSLVQAKAPWTVSISPSGESSLLRGIPNGPTITEPYARSTVPGAAFVQPDPAANAAPRALSVTAVPDANNPNGSGDKIIDLDRVLNLEVRASDSDGDPPYYEWNCLAAKDQAGNNLADLSRYGGRFSTKGQCRMEWDPETREWVGRATWTPAPEDKGGNGYQLTCNIIDRKGGSDQTGFPVTGQWLQTKEQPWVLYRTQGDSNNWEVWKMTLEGTQHQRLLGFDYQDVIWATWSSSGEEIVFASPDGIYRSTKTGSNIRKVAANPFGGGINGVAQSSNGDTIYYTGGGQENKQMYKVGLNSGEESAAFVRSFGSCDYIYGLTMFERPGSSPPEPMAAMGYYRHWSEIDGEERRHGLMVQNLATGENSGSTYEAGVWGTAQDRGDNYGPVFFKLESGAHRAMWGSPNGVLRRFSVTPGGHMGLNIVEDGSVATGLGYITDPRPTPDGLGAVLSAGGGIYYLPDASTISGMRFLPVAATNRGAAGAVVSRAH